MWLSKIRRLWLFSIVGTIVLDFAIFATAEDDPTCKRLLAIQSLLSTGLPGDSAEAQRLLKALIERLSSPDSAIVKITGAQVVEVNTFHGQSMLRVVFDRPIRNRSGV